MEARKRHTKTTVNFGRVHSSGFQSYVDAVYLNCICSFGKQGPTLGNPYYRGSGLPVYGNCHPPQTLILRPLNPKPWSPFPCNKQLAALLQLLRLRRLQLFIVFHFLLLVSRRFCVIAVFFVVSCIIICWYMTMNATVAAPGNQNVFVSPLTTSDAIAARTILTLNP